MSIVKILKFLPLVFIISFLIPQNMGFGGDLHASIVAAEREALYDRGCMKYGGMPYVEENMCPEIEGIRWVYGGMTLGEIRVTYERDLLNDKIKFALLASVLYIVISGVLFIAMKPIRRLRIE